MVAIKNLLLLVEPHQSPSHRYHLGYFGYFLLLLTPQQGISFAATLTASYPLADPDNIFQARNPAEIATSPHVDDSTLFER